MEKEIETGMEKAKKEVREEMSTELKAREERSENIVVYGIAESQREEAEERKEEDRKWVLEMAEAIGVGITGEIQVKFHAGKKTEGEEKPRPMVVRIADDDTRQRILENARRLARKEEWK